jgi:hypothetical protein
MNCRCEILLELDGEEALSYSDQHLVLVQVDVVQWEKKYICPDTGKQWLMDYPYSEAHGGGPPRLRILPIDQNLERT